MNTPHDLVEVADRFGAVARRFCSVVDRALSMDKTDLLIQIYQTLPKLIDEAISLPDVKLSDDDQVEGSNTPTLAVHARPNDQEWSRLYMLLKENLGNWDSYRQVFDPIRDTEAIFGSLADDIADIYRDLKEGLVFSERHQTSPEDIIWDWRFSFYSHWGKHAMDALLTIHSRLQDMPPSPLCPD